MSKRNALNIVFIFLFIDLCSGQEVVIGLQSNPLLKKVKTETISLKGAADTLELPVFDDFSRTSIVPDKNKWADDYVFINDSYSENQITTGVATLDALDNSGRLYETASSFTFEADRLTSLPIHLDYASTDSIWLSFYFEPGGLADMPEESDSLTLQFYAPEEEEWYSVWKASYNPIAHFKAVTIRIDDARYLKEGFRFRFINYASLSGNLNEPSIVGNCDQWNLDYILLDSFRNPGDTVFTDVAFRAPLRSLLKNHEAMPWKQFLMTSLQEMGSVIPIHYRNNDTIPRNVTRNFEIFDVYNNSVEDSFTAGAINMEPQVNEDYNANLVYTFNTPYEDSALFRVKSWLITDVFDPKENDTLVYYQRFGNYFAFDDGSSENGYGINGQGSRNAMVAYRFESFMQDTLRAVLICFNDSYLNANQRAFDLMVWDDNNDIPGNVIYSREKVIAAQGESINGFYTYTIPGGVMVDNVFYVGWKQRSDTFLNAGFDINTPHEGRQFYSISNIWNISGMSGSLMIRPVVGDALTTSINDINYPGKPHLNFWPNPASDLITFNPQDVPVSGLNYISAFDLSGKVVLRVPFTEQLDISSLHDGIYIIVAYFNGIPKGYNRLVKVR
jgi:hypothetical protein